LAASAITWITVASWCFAREFRRAGRILLCWAACATAYLAILVSVALLPGKSLNLGDTYCDDDFCINIQSVSKTPASAGMSYKLAIRIFSRALTTPQSAKGASVYLRDERGRRFAPVQDPSAIPFDVTLQPGESVSTTLVFNVPADAQNLTFAGGVDGIRYASFIIGNGDLLRKPRVKFRIQ
jgi:hypothetical protein